MIKIKKNIIIFLLFFLFTSCQSAKNTKEVIFDNSNMAKINFHAEKININNNYDMKLADSYIDYNIEKPPIFYLNGWIDENISYFGSENLLVINILRKMNATLFMRKLMNYSDMEKKLQQNVV